MSLPEANPYKGRHILLVEDEAIIALAERQTLETAGYRVTVAHSGETAVKRIDTAADIDLILMDINLGPGIDGTDAAASILDRHDLPIMFLSGHTEPKVVERTEGITSYGYIVKNSGDTVLLASIRMAFRLHEARQAVKAHAATQATLLGVSRNLAATRNLQAILQTASDRLAELAGLNSGAIYLVDGDSLILKATTPPVTETLPEDVRTAPLAEHPHIGRAVRSAAPVFIPDVAAEPLTPAERAVADMRSLVSILYVPLTSPNSPVGVFITGSTEAPVEVRDSTRDLCMTLANMAAVAVQNSLALDNCDGDGRIA